MAQYRVFRYDGQGAVVEATTHLEALQKCVKDMEIKEVDLNKGNIIVQGPRATKAYLVEKKLSVDEEIKLKRDDCFKICRFIYDELEEKFIPDDKAGCEKCPDYMLIHWLNSLMEYIAITKNVSIKAIENYTNHLIRSQDRVKPAVMSAYLYKPGRISYEKLAEVVAIRKDFESAFKTVRKGNDLSNILGYSFSKRDIKELAKLHKAKKFRKKIEDLLTDCNFHTECGDFINENYDDYLK